MVEDVEGDFAGGLDHGGLVGVVGLEVPVEDVLEGLLALGLGCGGGAAYVVEVTSGWHR